MDRFEHRDGRLHAEDVPLDRLAAVVGTPAYVYSLGTVRDHVDRLRAAFADLDPLICYAVKANSNLALLAALRDRGCGFDIVSGGELDRLRRLGVEGERIVFSGVGKTRAEMEAALVHGVRSFNVESREELDVLAFTAASLGRRADVALRLNPDVDPRTHAYIATGLKESKFGVDLVEGEALARRVLADPRLRLAGLQCHIGSQITDVTPYGAALGRVADLARRLRPDAPDLASIDMGGGFGILYKDAKVPAFTDYAAVVRPQVADLGLKLLMEPGRVIVGNAGVLLTRVLYRKQAGARRFVIVDAGMNDLLRPSLYGGWHRIWPVVGQAPPALGVTPDLPLVDVVGPVCESGDFLAKDRPLPEVLPGALLAVMGVGAYGFTMASNYNARPRPCEVVVDGRRHAVARTRETYDDLVRGETATPAFADLLGAE
jgi:diaminopimelate decarboxylase